MTSAERELLGLLNQERTKQGLPPLEVDGKLISAARTHSDRLAEHGSLSHQFTGEPALVERLGAAGVRFDASGENVGYADTVEENHDDFIHSSGHRANILGKQFNAVGIGIVQRSERLYVTEDFAHRVPSYSPADVEQNAFTAVNRIRAQHGLAALKQLNLSNLRQIACRDGITAHKATESIAGANWVLVLNAADPTQIPEQLNQTILEPAAHGIALGACYPSANKSGYAMFTLVGALFR